MGDGYGRKGGMGMGGIGGEKGGEHRSGEVMGRVRGVAGMCDRGKGDWEEGSWKEEGS